MKLCIPSIGVIMELTKPWTFQLHQESRNSNFWVKTGGASRTSEWGGKTYFYPDAPQGSTHPVTLPAGTTLKVSRIYIRQQKTEYDSITFSCNPNKRNTKKNPILKGRFWAKLDDVNRIECTVDHTTWPGITDLEAIRRTAQE